MMHIMLDLETADTRPTAAIIAIGAVEFNERGLTGRRFYLPVDLGSSVAAGLTTSTDTLAWWSQQSPEAQAVFYDPARVELDVALASFNGWLRVTYADQVRLWGNGAAFDNAVLANAFAVVGIEQPWKHWNDRCYRTVAATMPGKPTRIGTHHNAVDDAETQAAYLIAGAHYDF